MKPIVLLPSGESDADFIYGAGFPVETGLYIRFGEGDDVLVASALEIDRARAQARAAKILEMTAAGYEETGFGPTSWARLAAKLLKERGFDGARVSPRLWAAYLEELRAADVAVDIDRELFGAERRHKNSEEAGFIHAAQRAAEAAVTEVARTIASAQEKEGILHLDGHPLTSERLYARAQLLLGEIGYSCPEMIIAGSPECAMPHYRGEGPIRANAPVIIDIFPRGRATHYHGDLTRTVVFGKVTDEVRRMYDASCAAIDAGVAAMKPGVKGSDVHHAVCQVLVDHGFGTTTQGYEGPDGVAKMNHSTGHGVGLEVHEAPALRGPNQGMLEEGDVVTVEPGLYKMGLGGVRVEDTGIVTEDGFKNFTRITRSISPSDYI